MVRVEQVWRQGLPPRTELLAGVSGLAHEVSGIRVLRPRMPGLEPLHGDELIILPVRNLQILDPDLSLARAIERLARDLAAVAVSGTIPQEAVDQAESLGLPLFALPATVGIRDIERDASRFVLEQRTEWYGRKHSVLQVLTAIALEGQGLDSISDRMARLSDCAILIESEGNELLSRSIPAAFSAVQREEIERHLHGLETIPDQTSVVVRGKDGPEQARGRDRLRKIVLHVAAGNVNLASLSIVGSPGLLNPNARMVLEAGVTAVAVELNRAQAVEETLHRVGGDVVADLLRAEGDLSVLESRARRSGYDLALTWIAVALRPLTEPEETEPAKRLVDGGLQKRLGRHADQAVRSFGVKPAVVVEREVVVLFCPVGDQPGSGTATELAEYVCRAMEAGRHPNRVVAGVSRPHSGPTAFREGYREAREALRLGTHVADQRQVTSFADLGVHKLLLGMDRLELRQFHDDVLGILLAYDEERSADLIPTLREWLVGPTGSDVARRLNLHRNTLLYRLRRIAEIGKLDLDDAETRFALRFALRIREVLPLESGKRDKVGRPR